ncbi:MAG: hypothetical protein ROO73_04375 [Roseivirga sp.]
MRYLKRSVMLGLYLLSLSSFSGAKEGATTDQYKETHQSLAPVRVQVAAHRAKSLPGLSRLCLVLPNWIVAFPHLLVQFQ